MFGEENFLRQGSDVFVAQRAVVSGCCDAGDAVAVFARLVQGREVGGGIIGIPHAREAAHHEDFGKSLAAVDEIGDALG